MKIDNKKKAFFQRRSYIEICNNGPLVRPQKMFHKAINHATSYRLWSHLSTEPENQPGARGGQLERLDQICQMVHKVPRQSMNRLRHLLFKEGHPGPKMELTQNSAIYIESTLTADRQRRLS